MKVWILKSKISSVELLKKIYKREANADFDTSKLYYNNYGKPQYNDEFYFNVSHSKNYICIAISKSNVGIDIEENRKIYRNFNKSFFAVDECIINNNILNNWVIKEAYSKLLGLGLNFDFKKISAQSICLNNNIYNLSCNDYICYVIGSEPLEMVKFELN